MALLLGAGCPLRRCAWRAWSACSPPAAARLRAAFQPPACHLVLLGGVRQRVAGSARRALRTTRAAADGAPPLERSTAGHLQLIIGPMFAGKTTALLQLVQEHEDKGRKVVLIKSNKDSRYAADEVVSHDGLRRPCIALSKMEKLWDRVTVAEYEAADVIAVDEAQFFADLKDFCVAAADRDHKTVLVAGLDGDFRRRSFGQVLELVPHADGVSKLSGRCPRCHKPSLFSLRTVADSRRELVGGSEAYQPACRACYNELHRVDEHPPALKPAAAQTPGVSR